MAMDGSGTFAVVAVQASSLSDCSLEGSTPSVPHLYVYDMVTAQRVGTAEYPFCAQATTSGLTSLTSQNPTFTPPSSVVLAATPSESTTGGTEYYALGEGQNVGVYSMGASGTQMVRTAGYPASATLQAIAISEPGDLVAVGADVANNTNANGASLGEVRMFEAGTGTGNMLPNWVDQYATSYGKVDTMAMRGNVLAVGMDGGLFVYTNPQATPGAAQSTFWGCSSSNAGCLTSAAIDSYLSSQPNPVTHVALSANGNYLVAGTSTGQYYIFQTQGGQLSLRTQSSGSAADGAVVGVAISDDAKTVAVEWASGALLVLSHDPLKPVDQTPTTVRFTTTVPGVSASTPAIGISMAAAGGGYLVAPVGATVYGYTTSAATAGKSAAWTISGGTSFLAAHMSADGNIIGTETSGASGTFQGYKQLTQVRITPRYITDYQGTHPDVGPPVPPGALAQYQFTLTNTGTTGDSYTFPVVVYPSPISYFTFGSVPGTGLAPGQSSLITVNVTISGLTPATSYPFTVGVASTDKGGAVINSIQFYINVTKAPNIILTPQGGQARNFSITTIDSVANQTFGFEVQNIGNAPALVNLTTNQQPSRPSTGFWPIQYTASTNIVVKSGATVPITGTITAPTGASNGDYTIIQIQAEINQTPVSSPLQFEAALNPSYGIQLSTSQSSVQIPDAPAPGTPVIFQVHNTGNTLETVLIHWAIAPTTANNTDWKITDQVPPGSIQVPGDSTSSYSIYLRPLQLYPVNITMSVNALVAQTAGPAPKQSTVAVAISRTPQDLTPTEPWWTRLVPGPEMAFVLAALGGTAAFARRRR
jgi:hypothetical protein